MELLPGLTTDTMIWNSDNVPGFRLIWTLFHFPSTTFQAIFPAAIYLHYPPSSPCPEEARLYQIICPVTGKGSPEPPDKAYQFPGHALAPVHSEHTVPLGRTVCRVSIFGSINSTLQVQCRVSICFSAVLFSVNFMSPLPHKCWYCFIQTSKPRRFSLDPALCDPCIYVKFTVTIKDSLEG
jgi:hypothetical protein